MKVYNTQYNTQDIHGLAKKIPYSASAHVAVNARTSSTHMWGLVPG